jgi:hypothetical protein
MTTAPDLPMDRKAVLNRMHADVQRQLMEHSARQRGLTMEAQATFAINMADALDASGLMARIAELEAALITIKGRCATVVEDDEAIREIYRLARQALAQPQGMESECTTTTTTS